MNRNAHWQHINALVNTNLVQTGRSLTVEEQCLEKTGFIMHMFTHEYTLPHLQSSKTYPKHNRNSTNPLFSAFQK